MIDDAILRLFCEGSQLTKTDLQDVAAATLERRVLILNYAHVAECTRKRGFAYIVGCCVLFAIISLLTVGWDQLITYVLLASIIVNVYHMTRKNTQYEELLLLCKPE